VVAVLFDADLLACDEKVAAGEVGDCQRVAINELGYDLCLISAAPFSISTSD
jgi:hypothetical protein